jgi:RNA polymerase sigma-70 factor, ECF subfamily
MASRKASQGAVEKRKQAVQEIYEAYAEQIYKFVFFKLGNREDAEDITSQVFIKAANSLDIEQDVRAKVAWLYQVARTTITDYWRQYYKGPTSSLEQMEEASPLHLAAAPDRLGDVPDDTLNLAAEKVRNILALLPENYRQVLHYRFLLGYSLKETAAAMGITEANTKVLQHRALQKAVKRVSSHYRFSTRSIEHLFLDGGTLALYNHGASARRKQCAYCVMVVGGPGRAPERRGEARANPNAIRNTQYALSVPKGGVHESQDIGGSHARAERCALCLRHGRRRHPHTHDRRHPHTHDRRHPHTHDRR